MEAAESLGYIQYWGASKWLNLAKNRTGPLNILVSGGADLRHILKTCLDADPQCQITFYLHEKHKEPFCRQLLMMLILHTVNYTFRERTDLFLDVFGNSTVREKTQSYIDRVIRYIDNLISDEKKQSTALTELFDLKELKFKDRDEIVEVVRSWYQTIPFQMDKLRDQRLRYHYKERYDFRTNLIDWDYQMNLKEYAPIIHFYHYREWRQTGVAFESRFSTYPTANRTLSSYLPGKKKATHESCLVRGYWGDIIASPYISYGISTDVSPEKEKLFKVVNMAQSSHAVAVSEFNVQHLIQKLDNLSEYHLEFEDQKKKEEKQQEQLQKIEEKEEEEEEENKEDQNVQFKQIDNSDDILIATQPLLGFRQLKVKIVPIFEPLEKICQRSKFKNFFHTGFLGFYQTALLNNTELINIFSSNCDLYVENARFLVPLKKEERETAFQNIIKVSQEKGWSLKEQNQSEDHVIISKP